MKRDLKLCQHILETLERDERPENTPEVSNHLFILEDAGYIKLDFSWMKNRSELPIARLTWAGHDYLEWLRLPYGIYAYAKPKPMLDLGDPCIRCWL